VSVRYNDYLFNATRPNLRSGRSNNPTEGVTTGCGKFPAGQELGTSELYFDPCAYEAPPPGTLGNAGRNTIIAPSVLSMDVSVQRDFMLDAKKRLQFRAELFNFPNHTNYNAPTGGGTVVLSGGGSVVLSGGTLVPAGVVPAYSSRAGRISQTNTTSRQVQFALRLSF
jgi:hypothetical protein